MRRRSRTRSPRRYTPSIAPRPGRRGGSCWFSHLRERCHLDREVPGRKEVPEIVAVLVAGDPGLAAVFRVDARVAPFDAPPRGGAATGPRAHRGLDLVV